MTFVLHLPPAQHHADCPPHTSPMSPPLREESGEAGDGFLGEKQKVKLGCPVCGGQEGLRTWVCVCIYTAGVRGEGRPGSPAGKIPRVQMLPYMQAEPGQPGFPRCSLDKMWPFIMKQL